MVVCDGRNRMLAGREVFLMSDPLREKSWYQLASRRVVYLGVPPALRDQFSLAPPGTVGAYWGFCS